MFIRFCFGSWGWSRSLAVSRWSLATSADKRRSTRGQRKGQPIPKQIEELTGCLLVFVLAAGGEGV